MARSTKNEIASVLGELLQTKWLDDFDILIEGCLEYTMERLAQKNRT